MISQSENIFKVSAPGKIILHGEHSVVYGKLAIAASLDLRTTTTLAETQNNTLEIIFNELNLKKTYCIQEINTIAHNKIIPFIKLHQEFNKNNPNSLNHEEYLTLIVNSLNLSDENVEKNCYLSLTGFFYLYFGILSSCEAAFNSLSVKVKTELTLGAGTGSSASLMVSLAGALLSYCTTVKSNSKISFDNSTLETISKWAFCAEKIIHGNPSGIDNTVCTYGSLVSYRKGGRTELLKFSHGVKALLVDSKVPKNTGAMVQKVCEKRRENQEYIDGIFDQIEDVTEKAMDFYLNICEKLNENNSQPIYELIKKNHEFLVLLGISNEELDDIVRVIETFGLEAKITGAGGGGYAFTILRDDFPQDKLDKLCEVLIEKGYVPKITKLGGAGVTSDL